MPRRQGNPQSHTQSPDPGSLNPYCPPGSGYVSLLAEILSVAGTQALLTTERKSIRSS